MEKQAELIFKDRYANDENETWEQRCQEIARILASVEEDSEKWEEIFYNVLVNRLFIPGGRILRNAGQLGTNLLNCIGLVCEDSIESIANTLRETIIVSAEGAGVGVNFDLRPEGSPIKRKKTESSGVVSFMKWFDSINEVVKSGGDRRAALLGFIRIDHPEIYKFIHAKSEMGVLENFNISVAITHEFLDAVENDEEWPLSFGGHIYETVKARNLWYCILDNMIKHGEPGLLNFTNMSINNSYVLGVPIQTVNACSELNMERYGSCDLGSLHLPSYLNGGRTSWKLLEEIIPIAVRMLDNVLDVTRYPLQEIKQTSQALRRVGLGVMGLADFLFVKEIRYGSRDSIKEIDRLFGAIRDFAYEASVKLAEEKGSFPKYDAALLPKAKFIKKLPRHLQRGIKEQGLRNVTLLAVAPTGTTSLIGNTTSSIEPLFAKAYKRKDRAGERIYIHSLLIDFTRNGEKIPDWFVSTEDITPFEHLEVQTTVQRYVDSSISKTLNLPSETTVEDLDKMVLSYIRELKGLAVYVDGSRGEQVLNRIPVEEAKKHIDKAITEMDEEALACRTGVCEL